MLINVNRITKFIKDKEILKDISFRIYNGERIGIVGNNGVGKTTLLKVIMGEIEYDEGNIELYGRCGYLPQNITYEKDIKVYDFIKSIDIHKDTLEILSRFGLKDAKDRTISTLSGGEKTKLYLAKLVLEEPDLLILDEPTNHLDSESIEWLEKFINNYNGAVLMVTHDRYFLDKTVSKIFEIEDKKIKEYSGNYSFYINKKRTERQTAINEYNKYTKKKKELEVASRMHMERSNKYNNMSQNDFQRHKSAKLAKRSKAIISRINQMENKEKPKEIKKINIKFDENKDKTGNILIRAENLTKSYDKLLFKDVNFNLYRDKKVGILGRNGIGKSTLLKAVVGLENIDGNLKISPSTRIGYFSQELENLDYEATILEEIKKINNDESYIRTLLGCMLFRSDDVYKKVKDLSLGEKVRVIFLKLILQDNNLLVLDEPTNFLDINTREIIEDALLDYEGAILFVSHDRYFIQKMAQEIWEIFDNGLTKYQGGYEYYIEKKFKKGSRETFDNKEEILKLEMKLSHISFKLLSCNENEKIVLEKEYFDIVRKIKDLNQDIK